MRVVQPIGTIAGTAISRIAIMLAEEFARHGHESILVVWNRDKIDLQIDPRVKIIRTNLIGVSRRNIWTRLLRIFLRPILGNQVFLVFLAPLISRQLQKKVLDKLESHTVLLHAHSIFGFRYVKSPYFVIAHSLKSRQLLGGKAGWKINWLKKIYKKVYSGHHLITVSAGIGQDLKDVFGVQPASLQTIYNPLNIKSIRSQAREYDVPGDFVIAVGRNTAAKRFDRLLRIYAQSGIQQKLYILGRAAENKELRRLAKSLGLADRVVFHGFKANPYPYVAAAQCLLLTSDFEGFGMVLVEALALGTPVISTDCPCGPGEILNATMGDCLVPVEDEAGFAARLLKMMQNPTSIDPASVDRFDLPLVAQQYIDAIEGLRAQV